MAAVAYDAQCSASVVAATSANCSITIGSSSNRAVQVVILTNTTSISAITVTVGGNSLTAVSGSDSSTTYNLRGVTYCATTSLTGAQTVQVDWTTSASVVIGAISASGVDQTTPCTNGTYTGSNVDADGILGLSVTSTSGDLTATASQRSGSGTYSTSQNQAWSRGVINVGGYGAGSGTDTHTYTSSATNINMVITGANFAQVSAAIPSCTFMLLGVGSC